MISRLSATAALLAVIAAAGVAFAAEAHPGAAAQRVQAAAPMPMITLPRVEVTGHRSSLR